MSAEETKIWVEHLLSVIQSRKRGAAKAAATSKRKKEQAQQQAETLEAGTPQQVETVEGDHADPSTNVQQPSTDQGTSTEREETRGKECFCNACGEDYYSSNCPFWISCDLCLLWYCSSCEKLLQEPNSETYICTKCCN